jgi:hypothetical protein
VVGQHLQAQEDPGNKSLGRSGLTTGHLTSLGLCPSLLPPHRTDEVT